MHADPVCGGFGVIGVCGGLDFLGFPAVVEAIFDFFCQGGARSSCELAENAGANQMEVPK